MALGEVRLRDWWRVFRREVLVGFVLGALLGVIGLIRIVVWGVLWHDVYGAHYVAVAADGGAQPRRRGAVRQPGGVDAALPPAPARRGPASASAPFVATLVDVSGIVIYFTVET